MRFYTILSTLAIFFTLIACTPEQRIDATSKAQLEQSFDDVLNELPASEQTKFSKAFMILNAKAKADYAQAHPLKNFVNGGDVEEVRSQFDGKTASEIIREADQMLEDMPQGMREAMNLAMDQLEDNLPEIIEMQKEMLPQLLEMQKEFRPIFMDMMKRMLKISKEMHKEMGPELEKFGQEMGKEAEIWRKEMEQIIRESK